MSDESTKYPDKLAITPLRRLPNASVRVPGSKSITNRALALAALASRLGKCELTGVLRSEDTEVMVEALQALGYRIQSDWDARTILVDQNSTEAIVPADHADLFVANSGTSMRFLTALVAAGHGRYRLDGVTRMRERPIDNLLVALRQLGVEAASERDNGLPPVVIQSNGLRGNHVFIRGDVSSQFLSGLLMVAPYSLDTLIIQVDGPLVSRPYVDMTTAMMWRFGARVEEIEPGTFRIPGGQSYQPRRYDIEPDASAASYFWAAAAVTGGEVRVEGLTTWSLQGDVRFVDVLEKMGCYVDRNRTGITVSGGSLRGIDVDMNGISDTVMTLGAVACFAEGPTTIRKVAHIRHKETDRLTALAAELRRIGAEVEEFDDGLKITPHDLCGAEIETYNDHRMAMSLALVGLRVPGIVIKNPGCVAKTYPEYFDDLNKLQQF